MELNKKYFDGEIPKNVADYSDSFEPSENIGVVIVGGPDWIRLPAQLGGTKQYITGQAYHDIPCPKCAASGPTYVMSLDNKMHVACCRECGQYTFFNYPKDK